MAVSHKPNNNLINCNRCHLPFNYKNAVPKLLSCKHWYCFNCLEYLLQNTGAPQQDNDRYLECIQCQRSIDNMKGRHENYEKLEMHLMPQNNINNHHQLINNNNNKNDNKTNKNSKVTTVTTTQYGCDEELFAQRDYGNKSRSTSLASEENSTGSFTYFNNNNNNNNNNFINGNGTDLEGNIHFRNRRIGSGATEKMLPGENCFIHGMPNTLWCQTCLTVLCRGCNAGLEHKDHKIENQLEAKAFYQNCIKQEFVQIQVQVEEMENLKVLQKNFLFKLLETCCSLKLQIEHELLASTNTSDMDDMKDTMKNLQLCFGLLGKQTPNEILKLYRIIKDENGKLKMKHKQLLQQCKMQQLLSKSQKILEFDLLKEFYQKLDYAENLFTSPSAGVEDNNNENCGNNSLMMLTNYCIYRLYITYMKQQQQYIEEQVLRYQQYHQEQKKQNLLKQYKMLQQHSLSSISLQNQNKQQQQQQQQQHDSFMGKQEFATFYSHDNEDNKPKTYAEIATTPSQQQQQQQNAHQYDLNDSTNNGFAILQSQPPVPATGAAPTSTNDFQPYKKPLNKTLYEETKKTVQLLFNPINNENQNQIYYFDFERNGTHIGRVLIKVFSDIAPKMSYNFHALATHEKGFGYSGCKVFECHPNESIITGDIEQNTGYSSRSIYEDVQFVPDDTNIAPFAGAVGMRRAKKKFHSQGLVGSQFRIILTELGFTAIFGCVIEGIEVIKKISQTLVQNDKIHGNGSSSSTTIGSINNNSNNSSVGGSNGSTSVPGIFITQCGLYEFVKRDIMCGI